ncbi:MAG: hypothetical protein ABIX28_15690 [Vicinamibacterales bacterium]
MNDWPATVTTPLRLLERLLGVIDTVTLPSPVPLVPDATFNQVSVVLAVQLQPDSTATDSVVLPPAAAAVNVGGVSVAVQAV